MDRYLYLPIEVGSRELAAKCLIASVAAEQGYDVVLGFQHTLIHNASKLPPGVFLSKSSNNVFLKFVRGLGQAGHLVVAAEEESFGLRLQECPIIHNSKFLKGLCDLYLCIGDDEAAYLERRYGREFPKAVTGNARADFLRPRLRAMYEHDVLDIKKQHGKFILVNTNFGLVNPIGHFDLKYFYELFVDVGTFDDDDPRKNRKIFESYVSWEKANSQLVHELLAMLSIRPEYSVVIRPHPMESPDYWAQHLKSLAAPNIKLALRSPHIPFMLASDLTVHPGCTTGMEALALDVPALSLIGSELSPFNKAMVSNAVNVTAATAADALAIIENHWHGGDRVRSQQLRLQAELDLYLADMSRDTLSAEKIVGALTALLEKHERDLPSDSRRLSSVQWTVAPNSQDQYFKDKYGVTDEGLENTLSSLQSTLGRFRGVAAKKLFTDAYWIKGSSQKKFRWFQ